ncbi:MAG: alginate lyase family protein [Verrucomicrobiota bacterium]
MKIKFHAFAVVIIILLAGVSPMAAVETTGAVHTGVFPFYEYASQYDVWNYIPMDQGGRLIQLKVIGSDRDADVIKAIRSPGFFAPWGDPIRWDALEKTDPEKSYWLNRWYFLPCFARQYYLTGDKEFLKDMLGFIRKWAAENPVPSNLTEYFATKKGNWRDMQVAWRMQNLAWCYFLGEKGYSAAEKSELLDLVKVHARVLLEYFGKAKLNEGNHQSHGATAMLYAALLFPDLPEAAQLKEKALTILNHHLDQAFFDDGNSIEQVPGYYPFFVSIFRDAYLLCRANHTAPPARSEERLKQFYHYLITVAQPDGKMPPINDSTESDSSVSIRVLAKVFDQPYPGPAAGSFWFSASDQAVMRDASPATPAYAFLDAGSKVLGHWHGGKLGFHLWYGDKAFVVDSGISDYDDPLRESWYIQPQGHNTILVDGKGDFTKNGKWQSQQKPAGSRVLQWQANDNYNWAVMQHDGFQDRPMPVSWVRHFIQLKGIGTLLVDQLESGGEHEYTWLFHLLPCSPVIDTKLKSVFTGFAEKNLLILPATSQTLTRSQLTDGTINQQGRNQAAPVVNYAAHSTNALQAYLFLPVGGNNCPITRFNQTTDNNSVTLNLAGSFGTKRVQIIRSNEAGKDKYILLYETMPPSK